MSPRRPTLEAIRALHRDAAAVEALCASILLGSKSNATQALWQLPAALRRLTASLVRASAALDDEGLT